MFNSSSDFNYFKYWRAVSIIVTAIVAAVVITTTELPVAAIIIAV